ncbi:MAG: DNA mismatch repair protein MutS [Armatimonadota bacterium]|nr:DNA mismatch repair protein MutS [Armatimonadota bacterium]MCX7777656.1 DNA mismatch repair protein MutS [Armatimonadota bacterium]MDW8025902.1 DNA mismatch repair protein MutS [Armatimonadota bacterium]
MDNRYERQTPMLRQYIRIKQQYPDVILLFRLGDFYEMFGEDAKIGSQVLQLVLTSRDFGKGVRLPMCGIPHHAVERYIGKLLEAGYKVAVCEQLDDTATSGRLMRREVVRVLSPGTVVEEPFLDARENNFLVALYPDEHWQRCGIAVADVSTGEFAVTEVDISDGFNSVSEELGRLQPAELLLPHSISEDASLLAQLLSSCSPRVTPYQLGALVSPAQMLINHFGTTSLKGFGCEGMDAAIAAAAMVLSYLKETHIAALEHIRTLSTYSLSQFMTLDASARRNLELTQTILGEYQGSLLSVLDLTVTPMGGRLLKRWLLQPLLDVAQINRRLDAVEELLRNVVLRKQLIECLRSMPDIQRLTSRAATKTANPRDLALVRSALEVIPKLLSAMSNVGSQLLCELRSQMCTCDDLSELLCRALSDDPPVSARDGGIIRDGYNEELDELRSVSAHGKELILELEERERRRTGIKSLRVGYNQVFGYYIEVTKPNLHLVPSDYIRKQTTANAERFITPQLKELEAKVLGAHERICQIEYQLFCELRDEVARRSGELLSTAQAIATIDVLLCFAELADRYGYTRPIVNDGDVIKIRSGRHPVIERVQRDKPFVPNDCELNSTSNQVLIITGPNAAGKSTYLRQVALIVLMAQMGCFVPAAHAEVGVVDRIFTRVGAHDNIATGESTFMVEMHETANILNNATQRSLILIDEVGRGTSTFDGVSIAWAVAEYIHDIGAKCLFATHFHHLNELERLLPRVRNFRAAVKEEGDSIVFLYRIVPGGTDKSYGIQVAKLAGLPSRAIERAKEVLAQLEQPGSEKRIAPSKESAKEVAPQIQLKLFEFQQHPIIEELQRIDPDSMTPLEALSKIYEWCKQLKGGVSKRG